MENYDSMRKIGRGNYGTVYLARDTRNGKHYCLKQIQMETYSAEERANAQQEVEVLRTLDHPGIVRYREHFLHGDSLCVVMTYCEGGDLAATIKRRAKKEDNFTEAEVLDWFVQLVMALHHVHSKKILHRDLKTQNIFITKNLVKLGDFGIAKVMEGSMSAASTVIGTPYYMSPEVCQNQPYSYKSDVWALGCILYEMCALQQARSTRHAHAAHAARTPRAPRARRVRTPRTHAAHARRARTHARTLPVAQAWNGSNLLGLVYKIVQEKYPPLSDDYSEDLRRLVTPSLSLTLILAPTPTLILTLTLTLTCAGSSATCSPRTRQGGPTSARSCGCPSSARACSPSSTKSSRRRSPRRSPRRNRACRRPARPPASRMLAPPQPPARPPRRRHRACRFASRRAVCLAPLAAPAVCRPAGRPRPPTRPPSLGPARPRRRPASPRPLRPSPRRRSCRRRPP